MHGDAVGIPAKGTRFKSWYTLLNELQKSPPVRELPLAFANIMLKMWHYLGPVKTNTIAFGHHEGVCLFGVPRSRKLHQRATACGVRLIELCRMVGKPDHVWAMSSLMSLAIRELKRRKLWDAVITYADPEVGHNGNTYRAANWIDWGVGDSGPGFLLDGKRIQSKTLFSKHGTQAKEALKQIYGERIVYCRAPGKQRFLLWLTKPNPKFDRGAW